MKKLFFLLLAIAASASIASAHPGHGHEDGWSIVHFLVNAEHVLPYVAVVVALVLISTFGYTRRARHKA